MDNSMGILENKEGRISLVKLVNKKKRSLQHPPPIYLKTASSCPPTPWNLYLSFSDSIEQEGNASK